MELTINKKIVLLLGYIILVVLGSYILYSIRVAMEKKNGTQSQPPASATSSLVYNFNENAVVPEAGSIEESPSPYWWVDSGGEMLIKSGIGSTILGDLPQDDTWRKMYAVSSPIDTDNGLHPQNLFRLLTRSTWQNFRQEMYFKIDKDNLTPSPNRNMSNGILLFNRYKDSQNLYYAGLRVDGMTVIKKKLNGTYYILNEAPFFNGPAYDAKTNPSLLPKNQWIGLRTEVTTTASSTVDVKLYIDVGKTGNWKLALDGTDDGKKYGPIINDKAYAGVRTDFMDVEFSDYSIGELSE